MPVVSVLKKDLFASLGLDEKTYTNEDFDHLCFQFGIELDDVTSERKEWLKQNKVLRKDLPDDTIFKIEVPANRYDLLCLEGLSRALQCYREVSGYPINKVVTPAKPLEIKVDKSVADIRPFVVCGVLRNIEFTPLSYKNFIELQDKLHQNVCRERTLVSVGTHDLDTVQPPFLYTARKPADIKFVALKRTKALTAVELFADIDENDPFLKKYLGIIRDLPLYPVVEDSNGVVMSLPPIINGRHSQITLETKNVFIEVTATDKTKAGIVLDTIATMFSEYCTGDCQWTVESVRVVSSSGDLITVQPDFTPRYVTADLSYVNAAIGVEIEPKTVPKLLSRMGLVSELVKNNTQVKVTVPPTRSDLLHACDIMEDVAIGYGFNDLPRTIPKTLTVGKPYPLNKLSDKLRQECALAGYTEVLNLSLLSKKDNFESLLVKDDGNVAVELSGSKTKEYQVVRTNLLAGILKTVAFNKHIRRPLKVFELSDVVVLNDATEVGAENKRILCAVYSNKTAGFEVVHGLLDNIMVAADVPFKGAKKAKKVKKGEEEDKTEQVNKTEYRLEKTENPTYLPGRCATVYYGDQVIGELGIIHPEVLKNFGITFPCSALSLNVNLLL